MSLIFTLLLCFSFTVPLAYSYNRFNVPLEKLHTCHELLFDKRNANSNHVFPIEGFKSKTVNSNGNLHIKLFVSTARDARFRLSDLPPYHNQSHQYEFVIGGLDNLQSFVRRLPTSGNAKPLAFNDKDRNFLALMDITPIEIVEKSDGTMSVYIPGYKKEPILSFREPEKFDIKYLTLVNIATAQTRWLFNCDFEQPGKNSTNNITSIKIAKCQEQDRLDFNMDIRCTQSSLSSRQPNEFLVQGNFKLNLERFGWKASMGTTLDLSTVCLDRASITSTDAFKLQISNL